MTHIFRKGDVVSVTGTIKYDQDEEAGVFIDLDGYYSTIMLSPDRVTLLAPRIDVGERVRGKNFLEATVLARDVDKLWAKLDDGNYVIWTANEVTIVPPKAVCIVGPLEAATIERLKSARPEGVVELIDPQSAPLGGKVGSEEEA